MDGLRRIAWIGLLLTCAVAVPACGKKGPLRPPQWVIPEAPPEVSAVSAPGGIEVSWGRPRNYSDGSAIDDLDHFDVLRACEPMPDFTLAATLPVVDRDRFRKARQFSWFDTVPRVGQICRYRVVTVTLDEYKSPAAETDSVRRELVAATPVPAPTPELRRPPPPSVAP